MACKIERPDPQQLFDKYLNLFSTTVLGGTTIVPESNEWYAVSLNYAMAEEFHAISEQAWKESDPRYASCASLIAIAARDGVHQRPPIPAQGYIKLEGDPGAALDQNLVVTFGDKKYIPTLTLPTKMPTNGQLIVGVRALVPGPDGNTVVTTTGQVSPVMQGVRETATLYGSGFCGGLDAETCEQLRARYLNRIQFKPNNNIEKIKEAVLGWPCVSSVCETGPACCVRDEAGDPICTPTIELHAMFHGTFPCGIAPECVIQELNEWVFGARPGMGMGQVSLGICGKIVPVTAVCIDLTLDGLACATPGQIEEITDRVEEFFTYVCPSTPVYVRDIETIMTQVMGSSLGLAAFMQPATNSKFEGCDNTGLTFDSCGNANIDCGYKACLNSIRIAGTRVVQGGCA